MTVTPTPTGLFGPLAATAVVLAVIVVLAATWPWAGREESWLFLAVIPPATLLGARLWRWRTCRVVVTSERVIRVMGAVGRQVASLELAQVVASRVHQRWHERLSRRGLVVLELPESSYVVARVRRPDALARVIDHQRRQLVVRDVGRVERAEGLSRDLAAGLLTDDEYDVRWRHLFGPDGPRS